MIQVRDFYKCYDEAVAVRNLSFSVPAGSVLGLVGRNGAGKTTTLRSINGIIPATRGTLCVDGFDLSKSPLEVKKRTAYVPDDPQLFEDLSVQQHLQFQASVYGIVSPESEITRLLEMFELDTKRHARADALSRGMRQKLAICCAYLQKPKALLLDEPMTGLDPQAIRVLKTSVVEQAKSGAAVIISSHLLAMVESICTHVMVLDRGRCRFNGLVEELQAKFSDNDHRDNQSLEDAFFSALSSMESAVQDELEPAAADESRGDCQQTTATTLTSLDR